MFVFGTRPETIKLAPLIKLAREQGFPTTLVPIAQHSDLLQIALDGFGITASVTKIARTPGGSMPEFVSLALPAVHEIVDRARPDWVVIHGDTMTSFVGAQAAFLAKCRLAHVEAGLRTEDLQHPFPEEAIRQMIGRLADLNLAPTDRAAKNLERERVSGDIVVTGNTIVDAIKMFTPVTNTPQKQALISVHRREKSDTEIEEIVAAVRRCAEKHLDWRIIWLCHPSERIRQPVVNGLRKISNIVVAPPLGFREHLSMLRNTAFVVTDSGGITEEAGYLGIPTLICRDRTERIESIEAGNALLVGKSALDLEKRISELMTDDKLRAKRSVHVTDYGDGTASKQVLAAIHSKHVLELPILNKAA
jgi:UDP-N-acetylglucosamine 2-epimerase (non-hydrolysing)